MTDRGEQAAASEWDWILDGDIEIGGSLMFARGVPAARVIEAFGMDPAGAMLLPASRARAALRYPVRDERLQVVHPWIRAGQAGEWGFAIDESSAGYGGYEGAAPHELSVGTDVAWFSWTQTIDYFHYLADGAEVTAFEPGMGWDRFGSNPDRFVSEMRQVRLPVDRPVPRSSPGPAGPPGAAAAEPDFRIATLEMLTLALGIRLPPDIALGPLLTVQR
jgi:hypothetical protein